MAELPLDSIDRRVSPDQCHPKVAPGVSRPVPRESCPAFPSRRYRLGRSNDKLFGFGVVVNQWWRGGVLLAARWE